MNNILHPFLGSAESHNFTEITRYLRAKLAHMVDSQTESFTEGTRHPSQGRNSGSSSRTPYTHKNKHSNSEIFSEVENSQGDNFRRGRATWRNENQNERHPKKTNVQRLPWHVVELRKLMNEQGVLVVTFIADASTRALIQSVHLESRGLMLPHDWRALHSDIVRASRDFYEVALQDIPDIEIKDLNRLIKQDLERLIKWLLGRIPCIIILIHTL